MKRIVNLLGCVSILLLSVPISAFTQETAPAHMHEKHESQAVKNSTLEHAEADACCNETPGQQHLCLKSERACDHKCDNNVCKHSEEYVTQRDNGELEATSAVLAVIIQKRGEKECHRLHQDGSGGKKGDKWDDCQCKIQCTIKGPSSTRYSPCPNHCSGKETKACKCEHKCQT